METCGLRNDEVVLAGVGEVRIVGSTREAERHLASGFRPAVVLVGSSLCGSGAEEFVRRLHADPASAGIPVLSVAGDASWLRLTAVNDAMDVPVEPEALARILQVLEDLCAEQREGEAAAWGDEPDETPRPRRGHRSGRRQSGQRSGSLPESVFGETTFGSPDGSEG